MIKPETYLLEIDANLKWLIGGAVNNYSVGVFTRGTYRVNAYDLTEAIGCLAIEVNDYLLLMSKDTKALAECVDVLTKLEGSVDWADDVLDKFKYKWSTALYCAKTIVNLAEKRLAKGDFRQGVFQALTILIVELKKYRDVHSSDHNSFVRHIQEAKNEFELNDQLNNILDNANKREG